MRKALFALALGVLICALPGYANPLLPQAPTQGAWRNCFFMGYHVITVKVSGVVGL